jgi:outer membrane lipopolysaccharide assembly protein LptE/RlpB
MSNDVTDKEFEENIDAIIAANRRSPKTAPNMYDKRMNLAIFVSVWMLSCIIMYTYWYKSHSNLEYNKLIREKNTKELEYQLKTFVRVSKAYRDNMGGEEVESKTGESNMRRRLYTEMIRTIELFDKCNYIKMQEQAQTFPYVEIMISCTLLLAVCGVILASNLMNNPLDQLGVSDRISQLREEVRTMDKYAGNKPIDEDFKDKQFLKKYKASVEERVASLTQNGPSNEAEFEELNELRLELRRFKSPSDVQSGGSGDTQIIADDERRRLNLIRMKNSRLNTEINFLKSDATFNQATMTIVILVSSFYMGITLLVKSKDHTRDLYTGRLFMHSKCVT